MGHVTKNFYIITFSDSYKNIYDRSAVKETVLIRNVVIRNSVKLTLSSSFIFELDVN